MRFFLTIERIQLCVDEECYRLWRPYMVDFEYQPPNSSKRINRKLFRSPFLSLARHFFIYMNCSIGKLAETQLPLQSRPMKSCVGYLYELFLANYEDEILTTFDCKLKHTLEDSFLLCVLRFNRDFGVKFSRNGHQFSSDLMSNSFLLSLCERPTDPKARPDWSQTCNMSSTSSAPKWTSGIFQLMNWAKYVCVNPSSYSQWTSGPFLEPDLQSATMPPKHRDIIRCYCFAERNFAHLAHLELKEREGVQK